MSSKSTLMRSVGVNAVLALAGAPVCAQNLTVSTLNVGASIQTNDSLQGGVSRFFAEILRLKQISELAKSATHLLFLLDEILHGTNSHDRLIGAQAIVGNLIKTGAIGMVSTHDLALGRMAHDSNMRAQNRHLEDQIVDGKMAFDYLLRHGMVTKSNAIELMKQVGLEV